MSFDTLGAGGLDYLPCRYGTSKTMFRGPRRSLDRPYIAFFGGTTTYGKFIETPFPQLIEPHVGMTCVNFGCLNGGVDVFASDPVLREVATNAAITVIQVTSPSNISNRFYRVHPRRNDRFIEASSLLRTIYADVDYSEFNFTNHLLKRLMLLSPNRFRAVADELQAAWAARMRLILGRIPGKTVVLWAGRHHPPEESDDVDMDPAFVTKDMLEGIAPMATRVVTVVASADALAEGTDGMVFSELEAPAAETMLGPAAHQEIAAALVPVLLDMK